MIVAGLMSGTSLDGIDVAVVDIAPGPRIRKVVAHRSFPYAADVRESILRVSNAQTHTAEISRLNFLLPELYANAIRRSGVPLESIELIGCHGQTIYHESGLNTLQIGDGSVLAERTGVPVVSDFRPRDIAAGGRGAPLVPYVDYLLFRDRRRGRVALNIGGIANVSIIPAGAAPEDVIAFDTGPGNMVVDQLISRHTAGRYTYDRNGLIASKNHVNAELLDRLLADPFYRAAPPKTVGREQYGREFVNELLATGLPVEELIATATALTPAAIRAGVERFARSPLHEIVVAGGGVHNRAMMAYLAAFLPGVRVRTSDEFGIHPDAKEAIAFAVLAYETWHRRPSNLPSATGAQRAVILGKVSYT
jgi:anhydro-N-acetylmuramic acid kinase